MDRFSTQDSAAPQLLQDPLASYGPATVLIHGPVNAPQRGFAANSALEDIDSNRMLATALS